jgi:hypothetical protein
VPATVSSKAERVEVAIERIDVSAFVVPTDFPESDGTLAWDKTTLVVVEATGGGIRSLGYTYADTATAHLIKEILFKFKIPDQRGHKLATNRHLGGSSYLSIRAMIGGSFAQCFFVWHTKQ